VTGDSKAGADPADQDGKPHLDTGRSRQSGAAFNFFIMTNIQIEQALKQKNPGNKPVTIHFKGRPPVTGQFIQTRDFEELKTKNLWRIVNETKLKEFQKTMDNDLARIFNGSDFTRIVCK
jgi:hypothetical protein